MDGFQLERKRKSEGVDQNDLAIALGLSDRSTLTDVENGRIPPKEEWIYTALGMIERLKSMTSDELAEMRDRRRREGRRAAALI